ncbi:hypothetical protein B0H14DRAFT_3752443 [Mycena olivaceomarginata]|nr:hypothetical protein B0H14DRAFT_3752443 [Mycena olivaceomarginata]
MPVLFFDISTRGFHALQTPLLGLQLNLLMAQVNITYASFADILETIKLIPNTIELIGKGRKPGSPTEWADTEKDLKSLRSELIQLSNLWQQAPVAYFSYLKDQGARCRSTVFDFHSMITESESRGSPEALEKVAAFREQFKVLRLEITDLLNLEGRFRAARNGQLLQSTHDTVEAMIERLDTLFHDEKQSYTKFLACRDAAAQWLLDLLQELLDYDSDLVKRNRRRLFKALIRLSGHSKLYPKCFALTGLEQERHVREDLSAMSIQAFSAVFGHEALIWRQLSHPNLLPFIGLYYFQQRLCLVSPWMENGHIRGFLKQRTYDVDYLLSLILDVALGLEHLHAMGVVHGDLKGDNIFVTPTYRACIADFGLSSIVTSMSSIRFTNTSERREGGTARYQAPELHVGGHNNYKSDIYAFACLVYELLTGTAPFPELPTDVAVAMAVLQGHRPSRPPSCSGTTSMDGLWNLLQHCWEKKPELRPTTAQIVERLTGADIQAKQTLSTPDWDDTYTSKFRRKFLGQQPLPSIIKFEEVIFGHAQQTWSGSPFPSRSSSLLPLAPLKLNIFDEEDQANFSIYRTEIGNFATSDALSDDNLFDPCREFGDDKSSRKLLVSHSSARVHEPPLLAPSAISPTSTFVPPFIPFAHAPLQPRRGSRSRTDSLSSAASENLPHDAHQECDRDRATGYTKGLVVPNGRGQQKWSGSPLPSRSSSPLPHAPLLYDRKGNVVPMPPPPCPLSPNRATFVSNDSNDNDATPPGTQIPISEADREEEARHWYNRWQPRTRVDIPSSSSARRSHNKSPPQRADGDSPAGQSETWVVVNKSSHQDREPYDNDSSMHSDSLPTKASSRPRKVHLFVANPNDSDEGPRNQYHYRPPPLPPVPIPQSLSTHIPRYPPSHPSSPPPPYSTSDLAHDESTQSTPPESRPPPRPAAGQPVPNRYVATYKGPDRGDVKTMPTSSSTWSRLTKGIKSKNLQPGGGRNTRQPPLPM